MHNYVDLAVIYLKGYSYVQLSIMYMIAVFIWAFILGVLKGDIEELDGSDLFFIVAWPLAIIAILILLPFAILSVAIWAGIRVNIYFRGRLRNE